MKESTEELTNDIAMLDTMDNWCEKKKDSIAEFTLAEYLEHMLDKYGTTKKEVIKKAEIDTTYGYQIFQGKKKPDRNILLKMVFGFHMTVDETKCLLCYGNAASLYPRIKRDAYIMYALYKGFSTEQANKYLFENNSTFPPAKLAQTLELSSKKI